MEVGRISMNSKISNWTSKRVSLV